MVKKLLFLISCSLLAILLIKIVQADESPQKISVHYAFSPIHLAELAKVEVDIYNRFGEYEKQLEQRLNLIKGYRWEYENSVFNALQTNNAPEANWDNALFLASHPVLVYRMIGRFSRMLPLFYEDLQRDLEDEMVVALESMRAAYTWPTLHDLSDASKSIFRLQETYGIDPVSMADGFLHGLPTNGRLTARHCVELAEIAMAFEDSLNGGEWLKTARELMNDGDTTVGMDEFVPYWVNALRLHGKTWNIDDIYAPDVFQDARIIREKQYEEAKFNLTFTNRIQNFKAICRGEVLPRKIKASFRGYCFYHKRTPFFLIAPEAIEVHSTDPAIIEIHNFFGDGMIQETSNVGFHSLMDAALHHTEKEDLFNNGQKTTAPALIYESFPSMTAALRKIEAMFGFSFPEEKFPAPEGAEEQDDTFPFLYMQAYSVGNFHEPCLNCEEVPPHVERLGSRIATAHFMLDNTAAGGDIAFTHLGLKIGQKKGSVLIFFDDGTTSQDYRRLRGLCPVLIGSTWMATKHVYENGNCLAPSVNILDNF